MKRLLPSLFLGMFALCMGALAVSLPTSPVHATVLTDVAPPNIIPKCYADVTSVTFATTSYADVTGATCAFTPTRNDPTTASLAKADLIWVSATLQASKATTLTGTCGIYVNGAILATTERVADVGSVKDSMALSAMVPNTTVGVQTVKLQCKSADTAVLTVSAGFLTVLEIVRF